MNESPQHKIVCSLNYLGYKHLQYIPSEVNISLAKYIYYEYDALIKSYSEYKIFLYSNATLYIEYISIPVRVLTHIKHVAIHLTYMLINKSLSLPSEHIHVFTGKYGDRKYFNFIN